MQIDQKWEEGAVVFYVVPNMVPCTCVRELSYRECSFCVIDMKEKGRTSWREGE